jgi:malonyl-CoA O-methyltransferase
MEKVVKEQIDQSAVINEFSRFAHSYDNYNIIQRKVANTLVNRINFKHYDKIIDLGCGSGNIYKNLKELNISFNQFIAIDSSPNMLNIHPSHMKIEKICIDFDSILELNQKNEEILLLSSSSIQWSKDLNKLFSELSKLSKIAYFAIFTDNTFKTIHKTAKISSPLYSEDTLISYINKYYEASFDIKSYQLEFQNTKDMFHYIKRSGVSGGEKRLTYKEMKKLISSYPLNYLEFEVMFVKAIVL